jgi:hypothetical protein
MHLQLPYECKIRSAHNLILTNFEIMGGHATNANSNSRVAICHNVHHAHDLIMFTYFLHESLHNHTTNLQCKSAKIRMFVTICKKSYLLCPPPPSTFFIMEGIDCGGLHTILEVNQLYKRWSYHNAST